MSDGAQHVRVHLTGAGDLQPAVVAERHVDLRRRLGEREERRPEAQANVVALEEVAQELGERSLEVGERDVPVDPQALDLMEHRRVRGVAVHAIDAARRDDLDRRLVRFHVAHLDRRRMRPQHHAAFDIEGVLHRARRVILRRVQRGEVVEVVLDLRAVRHREAQRVKELLHAFLHARQRMQAAAAAAAAGQRHIDRVGGELRVQLRFGQCIATLGERFLDERLDAVDASAGRGTIGRA